MHRRGLWDLAAWPQTSQESRERGGWKESLRSLASKFETPTLAGFFIFLLLSLESLRLARSLALFFVRYASQKPDLSLEIHLQPRTHARLRSRILVYPIAMGSFRKEMLSRRIWNLNFRPQVTRYIMPYRVYIMVPSILYWENQFFKRPHHFLISHVNSLFLLLSPSARFFFSS